jgi:hypothetical protein
VVNVAPHLLAAAQKGHLWQARNGFQLSPQVARVELEAQTKQQVSLPSLYHLDRCS